MIVEREALAVTHQLHAAGYLANIEGQAEVWARVLNKAAPWATISDVLEACEAACSKQLPRVNTGEVVAELNRARERAAHEERRRLQLERTPEERQPISRERLREIFNQHGLDPWKSKESK